jgi:hypothetical protein
MSTAAKISIQIDAQTATLQKGFAEAKGAINQLDAGMSNHVAMGMAKFTAGLAIVKGAIGAVRGAMSSLLGAMNEMDEASKFAARLGTSADALTVLGFAAEQAGSSQDALNLALEKMQNNVSEAATGLGTAKDAIAQLGLSAADLTSMSADKQFAAIAEQIQNVGSASDRTRIAMDIFGRSGGQLIPLLSEGAEGLNAYGAEAEQMGLLLGNARGAVEEANDSINKMKRAWGAFVQQVAVLVAPALSAIAEALASIVGWFNKLMGHASGASAPFDAYASQSKKAAIVIEKAMDHTAKVAKQTAEKIKETWKDIPKPTDWTTPGVGAATRGSVAGFTAVQEARRGQQDAERRQRELTSWLARIYERQRSESITLEPVNI